MCRAGRRENTQDRLTWVSYREGAHWDPPPPLQKFETYDVIITSTAIIGTIHNYRLDVLWEERESWVSYRKGVHFVNIDQMGIDKVGIDKVGS